jgi:acyl-CoA synthetase (AMP-forming)/AMP-acid ligase II
MADTQKRFEELTGGVIVEGYSLTEAQMAVVANPVRGEKKIGSVGMPLPDVEVRILDPENGHTPMPQGEIGEIVIKAPQLMQGYWHRPEETREMLRTDGDGHHLLFTGDLGYLDIDGYLFIVDRKKDLIKVSGYQVWPREIEEVISGHPSVARWELPDSPTRCAAKGQRHGSSFTRREDHFRGDKGVLPRASCGIQSPIAFRIRSRASEVRRGQGPSANSAAARKRNAGRP